MPRARSRYAARVYRKLRHATEDRRSPSSSLLPTQSTKPVPSPAPSLFANPQRHQYFTSCSHGAKFLLLSGALCCSAPIQDSFPEPHVLSRPDLHPQAVCCPGFVLGFPQPFYQPRRPRLFSSSSLLEQHILPVGELSLGEEIKYFSPVTLTQCGERTAEDRFEPPREGQALLQLTTQDSEKLLSAQKGSSYHPIPEGTAEIPPAALDTHTRPSVSPCCWTQICSAELLLKYHPQGCFSTQWEHQR